MRAIRATALARVLAILDEIPDTATVRERRPVIEVTADRKTVTMLRRFSHP